MVKMCQYCGHKRHCLLITESGFTASLINEEICIRNQVQIAATHKKQLFQGNQEFNLIF